MPRPIDADALVAKLDDWRGDREDVDEKDAHDVAYYSAMSRALRFAKDAPTLDYAPVRHGELLFVESMENDYETEIAERCSLCGRFVYRYQGVPQDNYCPNCGAKMGAKEDADENA